MSRPQATRGLRPQATHTTAAGYAYRMHTPSGAVVVGALLAAVAGQILAAHFYAAALIRSNTLDVSLAVPSTSRPAGGASLRQGPYTPVWLFGRRDRCFDAQMIESLDSATLPSTHDLGQQWNDVGGQRPPGPEIENERLAAKLQKQQLEFTPAEWHAFELDNSACFLPSTSWPAEVTGHCYIKAGNKYFQLQSTGIARCYKLACSHISCKQLRCRHNISGGMECSYPQVYDLLSQAAPRGSVVIMCKEHYPLSPCEAGAWKQATTWIWLSSPMFCGGTPRWRAQPDNAHVLPRESCTGNLTIAHLDTSNIEGDLAIPHAKNKSFSGRTSSDQIFYLRLLMAVDNKFPGTINRNSMLRVRESLKAKEGIVLKWTEPGKDEDIGQKGGQNDGGLEENLGWRPPLIGLKASQTPNAQLGAKTNIRLLFLGDSVAFRFADPLKELNLSCHLSPLTSPPRPL